MNSAVAARVHTADTTVFVKGLRSDHRRAWTQQREADINPSVRHLAPAVLWHVQEAGWDLLGFEDIDGHHANYTPRSPDLPLVVSTMARLSSITAPGIVLKSMPDRMKSHSELPELFAGTTLLHTDWFPTNVLVAGGRAALVDWAWASRGAAWIDPALWVVWLVKSGHTPEAAEGWAARVPAWNTAGTPPPPPPSPPSRRRPSACGRKSPRASRRGGLSTSSAPPATGTTPADSATPTEHAVVGSRRLLHMAVI
ncbi:aminoglycoside phosphotransferase [Streptomyces spororaveus]|uniref:aminoglycoside phosphotransferase n=1 Tax=Streptomyces spororaveus TaxID=284039 RepID=UPI0037BCDD81